mgnify:CR=1 FL=1
MAAQPVDIKESLKNTASQPVEKKKQPSNIKEWIGALQPQISQALPKTIDNERFMRMALNAVANNQALQECSPRSFLAALMNAAQLGLEPNTPLGQAYLLPYNTKQGKLCQFQIGYKGLIDLAYRSGEFRSISAHVVYSKDYFDYELGLDAFLKHKPATGDRGSAIYVYGVFRLQNGGYGFEVMSIDDVKLHAQKYSKSYTRGPWQTNFEEMAKKTVIRKLLKYAPLKVEVLRAISTDGTIKEELNEDMTEINPSINIFDTEEVPEYEADGTISDEPVSGNESMF